MKKPGLLARFLKLLRSQPLSPPPVTPRAQHVIESATLACPTPRIKNVAIALLDFNQGVSSQLLQHFKIDLPSLRAAIDADASSTPLDEALAIAHEERRKLFHHYLGTEHLLLATLRCMSGVEQFFEKEGLDLGTIRAQLTCELDPNYQSED